MLKLGIIFTGLFLAGWAIAWWSMPPLRRFIGFRFVINYVLILLGNLLVHDSLSFWAIVIVTTVATIRGREDALCRLMLLTPLIPGVTLALGIGGVYFGNYTSITCVVIACLISAAISRPSTERPVRGGFSPEDAFVILLFLISGVFAVRFESATALLRGVAMAAATFLLPYWFLRKELRTTEQIDRMVACLVAASFPIVVIALFEIRSGWGISDVLRRYGATNVNASSYQRGGFVRASATLGGPLLLAYYMMLAMIGMFTCRRWFRPSAWRWCLLLVLLGFLAPQSRGAFLAIIPGGFVLLLASRRFGAAAGLLALSGLGGLSLLLLRRFSTYIDAMLTGQSGTGHYDYRGFLLERGIQEFWKRPIIGTSISNALDNLRDLTQGEGMVDLVNTYLWMALVSGAIGLGAFVLLMAAILRKLIARARRGERLEATRAVRAFLLASLTLSLVNLVSVSFIERLAFLTVLLVAFSRATAAALIPGRRRPPPIERPLEYEGAAALA